ncbi:MAG: cupin domain-containing protein [Candidatus Thorarchaeota archaeon]|jgi:quercetin dioxygenase-like cupin family protein
MVRIYRAEASESIQRSGYEARYFADITFKESINSCGMILVTLEPGSKSSPHGHEYLEEVFMALTRIRVRIDNETIELEEGDVLVVDPGEMHSFEVIGEIPARLLAMKFPNLKDDKIIP